MSAHRSTANNDESELFSASLEKWLKRKQSKTMRSLIDLFAEKSFAIIFLLLMALPALPIPTGGVTHITEIITMLVCLELIIGRRTVWLPERWLNMDASKLLNDTASRRLLKVIRWFERWSKPRWSGLLHMRMARAIFGLVILGFTMAAFIAPPFSGLDTLPSLGVVIMSLGLIFEDFLLIIIGAAVGVAGIALEITAGAALYEGIRYLF
jgi:hypothetical protein